MDRFKCQRTDYYSFLWTPFSINKKCVVPLASSWHLLLYTLQFFAYITSNFAKARAPWSSNLKTYASWLDLIPLSGGQSCSGIGTASKDHHLTARDLTSLFISLCGDSQSAHAPSRRSRRARDLTSLWSTQVYSLEYAMRHWWGGMWEKRQLL